jgi:hypothetical protein
MVDALFLPKKNLKSMIRLKWFYNLYGADTEMVGTVTALKELKMN